MRRPLYVTTNAAVNSPGTENAASTAARTFARSISVGIGDVGSTSPMGHSCVDASGSALFTVTGVKLSVPLGGSVTHPWLPVYFATRAGPFGTDTLTVRAARSTTGFPSFLRLEY